jgi:serine/threonine-protein kinase
MLMTSSDSMQRLAAGLGLLPGAIPFSPHTPLGRFALLRHLGSGGRSAVYGAYDAELDREVALKLLAVHEAPHARAEARALARLSHPNIVSNVVGECEGRPFIAMELVEGEPLRRWLDRHRRDRVAVIGVFVQLARALQAVHAAGFVHRDVKPDNVVVGDDGRVRLVDFGLVHRQGSDAGVDGTPAYMAPELFDGAAPDPRCDQFAFAVSLFEALTGERPFQARSIVALQLQMRDGALLGRVPASLRPILQRALDPRPRRRFASMAALEAALLRTIARRRARAEGGDR